MELYEVADDRFVLVSAHWPVIKARQFIAGLPFTHVIVHRSQPQEYFYLYSRPQVMSILGYADDYQSVLDAFNLHEYMATQVMDACADTESAPERVVVRRDGRVIGFVDQAEHLSFGPRQPLQDIIDAVANQQRQTFSAYPALAAPEHVEPGDSFDIFVGFRCDRDPGLEQSELLIFNDLKPGDECLVMLIGDGIDLDRSFDTLPFKSNAQVRFSGKARPNVEEASVTAQYLLRNQLIGITKRRIAVGAPQPKPYHPRPNPCRLAAPDLERAVDLTVTVRHLQDRHLHWTINAPNPSIMHEWTSPNPLQDAREFVANLLRNLKTLNHSGKFAANVLDNYSQGIANLMPPEFFDILAQVYSAIGRTPTLLLITNEPYVPWELARLPQPLDAQAPRFLSAQTQMGRWLDDQQVMLPPVIRVDVRRFTVIASQYGWESDLRELKEAIAEQVALAQRWQAIPLEATSDDLMTVIDTPKVPGHLIHFAVHGSSDPQANEQVLLLADKQALPAESLTEVCGCGEVPRFAFVFLNACQVGAPGQVLGQAAGFPNVLISRGAAGFIAPLWEVDDELARELAVSFYEETLAQDQPIGAVLQQHRRSYHSAGSTTPVAYIYYGHPASRLKHAH